MKLQAVILIEPVPKARARYTVRGGKVRAYTPANTREAELIIMMEIRRILSRQGRFQDKQPVRLVGTFFLKRPQSLPKKITMPVSRPDWDNFGKLLSDSLNFFVYRDDSQVTTAIIKKRYGFPPRIEITLEEDSQLDERA